MFIWALQFWFCPGPQKTQDQPCSQVSGMYLHCVCCCGDDADACFLQKSNNADAWFVEQLHTLAACHGEFAPACPAKMSRV